ncbi:hypothetical protein DFH06DRAFT_160034 [Mycena polygramma]|nr:hypothetical protein DFH06DRAFT_160034 [Mycena polygramma]
MAALAPGLPADLERLIFEVATLSWPRSIPRFMLVAWRVKTWVEPLLYRIIVVDDSRPDLRDKSNTGAHHLAIESSVLLSLIHTKGPSFFRDHVRHFLLVSNMSENESDLLSACSDVEDLWWSHRSGGTLAQISDRRLKRLHCGLYTLFDPQPVHFTHKLFASITHLEIFDIPEDVEIDEDVWAALTRLPHLTHLAFNDENYVPLCLSLLTMWPSLQVLAILLYQEADKGPVLLKGWGAMELAEDLRLVTMISDDPLEDWFMGAYTGVDYWSRAEDFIAKRKSGEINHLEYFVDGENATETDGEESE